MLDTVRRQLRRSRQTITTFENGPRVLARIGLGDRGRGPAELTFELRGGGSVTIPNVPGARVPVYEVFAEDAYRLEWFTDDLGPAASALDIGGHVGCFTLAFARSHPAGTVHTYEASATTAAYLRRNVDANGLGDRVTLHNAALSDHAGTIEFADNGAGSAQNGLTAPSSAVTSAVPAVTFAQAVAAMPTPPQVVKIDIEGFEYDVVLGSSPEDWASVQRVVLEYHDVPGHDVAELEKLLGAAGLVTTHQEAVTDRHGTLWLSRG
jgi:FkbM family methyltransferase